MARTILVLHGYAQNGLIFSKRIAALRKQCKGIEFVFVDGPVVLDPVDPFAPTQNHGGKREPPLEDAMQDLRGWTEPWKVDGIDASLAMLRDVVKGRKFDGILGFSQGAAVAALLAAILEKPDAYPDILVDGKPPHPPFDFCLAACGYRLQDPRFDAVYRDGYSTPTLHLIGRADKLVGSDLTQSLVDVSLDKRVEYHDGGHFVPSKTPWRKFLQAYLSDHKTTAEAPKEEPADSAPASGTATPNAAPSVPAPVPIDGSSKP
ncbi:serine hydrolase FSH [Schizophyllum amplum]|uniref:Serine hydrolase FSH n=1 Tax=Schizophyllum amplum TaxID=97359 RepID=A0A550CJ52_9AGAR|nr:serine hydrolase FSH [Auriculariopsis ampla]